MMRMRVGLQHVLNDPVGLFYSPVLLSLSCMYFTQHWWPPRVRISCCSIIIHVMMIYIFFQIVNTELQQLYRDIVVLSRSLRKQDVVAQCIVRKQDNDGWKAGPFLIILRWTMYIQTIFWRGRFIHVEIKSTKVSISMSIFSEQASISP